MLAARGYKTKKELKEAVGQELRYTDTSAFGAEYNPNGSFPIVGPSAYERKWFAVVVMQDGKIKAVK